jgi:hypothetical protein
VTQDQIPRLLDAAVPSIPPRLRTPPYEGIRRRAKRRRATVAGSAAAIVVAATAIGLVTTLGHVRGPSTVVGATPTSEPSVNLTTAPASGPTSQDPGVVSPMSLRIAKVDRAGTGLTLYLNPSRDPCLTYPDAVASVDERANDVVVAITGKGVPTECERTMAAPIRVNLAQPLGNRTLWSDGRMVRVFFDADLPQIPSPWMKVTVEFTELDGSFFADGYTRPGGPDLDFRIFAGTPPDSGGGPGEWVALGSRQGTVVNQGDRYGVRWQAVT